jgi:ribosome recycling factor
MIEALKDAELRMHKSVESLKHELHAVRTGRAHPSLLESLRISSYGSEVPLTQVANITIGDTRTLVITPWDKNNVAAIEKAILASDLGLNPATQGTVIRVPLPALTEERRRDLTKVVKAEAEGARIAIRNIRRDLIQGFKDLQKAKEMTEDELKKAEEKSQKLTDQYILEVDQLCADKEKDLLAI